MAGSICPERQSHDDIQVGLRQTPDCKNGPCMLGVLQDQIGRQNRTGAVRLKQAIVLRMAGLDVRQAFIGEMISVVCSAPKTGCKCKRVGSRKPSDKNAMILTLPTACDGVSIQYFWDAVKK